MAKKRLLILEATVDQARARGESALHVPTDAIVTPQARDRARDVGIVLLSDRDRPVTDTPGVGDRGDATAANRSALSVAIGADHGGYELKAELAGHVTELGWRVVDVGTNSPDRCDYPDFAYAVASAVASGKVDLGIMIDGAGPGSAIVCNKVPGIRAAAAASEFHAWNARAHNNCNVLTLGSRGTGIEVCKRIVDVFLATSFEGGRHAARVDKIMDVERRFVVPKRGS